MPTTLPKEPVVAGLRDVWTDLDELLAGLDDAEWATPTCLPGWDVQAVVAHVIGTEAMLLGESAPVVDIDADVRTHVRNDIARFNEAWVIALADEPPAAVLALFRDHVARRLEALDATTEEAWETVGFTPAGQDTYGRFMRIRAFDCWMHEQDIRDAVGRPGGEDGPAARLAIDEMAAALGYLVGKKGKAPQGSRVLLELTGTAGRTVAVEVAERAAIVDELSGAPTVTLTMPIGVFARLGGGRADPTVLIEEVVIDGDPEVGERIVANMAYTI